MPCNSVRTMAVDLGKVSPFIMESALKALSLGPQHVDANGIIRFGNREWINTRTGQSQLQTLRDVSEIKRAYSAQVVQQTAKRFGWQIKTNAQNQNKMQLIRR